MQYAGVNCAVNGAYFRFLARLHIADIRVRARAGRAVAYYHARDGGILGDIGFRADENKQKADGAFLKGKRYVLRAYFGGTENKALRPSRRTRG